MPMLDQLGDRMKECYEGANKPKLTRRTPVIIRLDGCHFHTYARGFKKPYDPLLAEAMRQTMLFLCESVQGCVLGYTQSDEITLVLTDYATLTTEAWFGYDIQKVVSVSASLAAMEFNRVFAELHAAALAKGDLECEPAYQAALAKGAYFDSRAFNVPKEEVTNCVLWRQIDAERNSVSSNAQALFSQKQLEGKSVREQKSMLESKGVVWGELPTCEKRGCCAVRDASGKWVIDLEIPRFVEEGRDYIERLIAQPED